MLGFYVICVPLPPESCGYKLTTFVLTTLHTVVMLRFSLHELIKHWKPHLGNQISPFDKIKIITQHFQTTITIPSMSHPYKPKSKLNKLYQINFCVVNLNISSKLRVEKNYVNNNSLLMRLLFQPSCFCNRMIRLKRSNSYIQKFIKNSKGIGPHVCKHLTTFNFQTISDIPHLHYSHKK